MKRQILIPLLMAALFWGPAPVPAGAARAAEFDIDAGRIMLRRLQYCVDCGSALLVTGVPVGVPVRCPDCGREQPRIDDKHTLTQLYQLCRSCSSPLDPDRHHAGDVVECGLCHTRQALSADAFLSSENTAGLGFVPGFPPGSGKKTLLLSPNRPDAALTVIPLDDGSGELPPPPETELTRIAPPPAEESRPAETVPPLPEMPPLPELIARNGTQTSRADPMAKRTPTRPVLAVEVPAVTADLFGGPEEREGGDVISSGRTMARVDGIPVYDRDVERVVAPVMVRLRRQAGPGDKEALVQRERELRREVLDRLIDRELILREAAALGHRPAAAAVRERENELAQILAGTGADPRREAERDIIVADMRRRFAERPGTANPREVREFYQQHKSAMMRPRLIALDQLVVFTDRAGRTDARNAGEIALEIARSLEQGMRFDEVRERYDEFSAATGLPREQPSLQPGSAYSGRVIAAGGDLRQGAVFGPVPMDGLILFAKVTEERPAGPVPFEEVEKEIRERLESEATERLFDAWVKRLRAKARVEFASGIQ